jgi:hypothetical protein
VEVEEVELGVWLVPLSTLKFVLSGSLCRL